MLRCLAIDDEPLALELLTDNISKVPYLQLVASCDDPIKALSILQTQEIDLVFVDIQMPGLTGLQLIQSLIRKPMFILITAYEKYALEGFNLDVIDYLVKPVSLDRFIKACNKAQEWHQLKHAGPTQQVTMPDFFFIKADYSLVKVAYADVIWVEGLKDYVAIHLQSTAKPLIARVSMKSVEEQLPAPAFLRIHKSYLVSIRYITAVRKHAVFIGTRELPVGDAYREALATLTGKTL